MNSEEVLARREEIAAQRRALKAAERSGSEPIQEGTPSPAPSEDELSTDDLRAAIEAARQGAKADPKDGVFHGTFDTSLLSPVTGPDIDDASVEDDSDEAAAVNSGEEE